MAAVILLVGCAVAIYLSCEWFVNAVEWLGQRLNMGHMAVGTILAAFGTALPESTVTFVAVVFGDTDGLGVGAAMGGPLALATVAYAVVGGVLLLRRRRRASRGVASAGDDHVDRRRRASAGADHRHRLPVSVAAGPPALHQPEAGFGDLSKLARDQHWFLAVFVVKVALGLVAFAIKPWLGLVFFAVYGLYFWREVRGGPDEGPAPELEPLRLQPKRTSPDTWAVLVQTVAMLAVIFVASHYFVAALEDVGPMLGLSAAVTALLLAPLATELPEVMNAVIWVRQGKTPLALANISGSMMIQVTVPSGLGLLFTPWRFDAPLILAGAVTIAAIVFLLTMLRTGRFSARTLTAVGGLYVVFGVALVPLLA